MRYQLNEVTPWVEFYIKRTSIGHEVLIMNISETDLLNGIVKAIESGASGRIVCAGTYIPNDLRQRILEWDRQQTRTKVEKAVKKETERCASIADAAAGAQTLDSATYACTNIAEKIREAGNVKDS